MIHPHFHRRRTGVTRHVESVVPSLDGKAVEAAAVGYGLDRSIRRLGVWRLLWRARREGLVWHAHRNIEVLAGLLLRLWARRTRLVFTRHSSTLPSALTRWLLRRVDRVVALTPEIARLVGGNPAVVPHGVSLSVFTPPGSRRRAWQGLGLGGDFGVGVLGRVRPAKGQGDFVEAVAPLLSHHSEWSAAIVGAVRPRERGWAAGLRKRSRGRIHFVSEQSEVTPWYQGLTILVQPSHSEGFSMVVLEALASGCCVVATALPQVDQVIEQGVTGFIYPPGDARALAELLEPLLREPDRAERIGRAAAEAARPLLGLEREALLLTELYRSLDPSEGA